MIKYQDFPKTDKNNPRHNDGRPIIWYPSAVQKCSAHIPHSGFGSNSKSISKSQIHRLSPSIRMCNRPSGNRPDLQNILILTADLASRRRPFYFVKRRKLFSLRCLDVIQITWRSVCVDLSRLVRTWKKEEAVDRVFDRHLHIHIFLDVIHIVVYSIVCRWPMSARLFNELFRIRVV